MGRRSLSKLSIQFVQLAAELIALAPNVGESWYHPACFHSKAGEREKALHHLAEAVRRDASLGARARTDPDFAPLARDVEFLRLTGGTSQPEE